MNANDPKATFGAVESESNESGVAAQKQLNDSSNHSQTESDFSAHEQSSDAQPSDTRSSSEQSARKLPNEVGGRKGPEPTRYGDWEKNGRCIDF